MTHRNLRICILAHNEENNIAKTISSLMPKSTVLNYNIHVYANGCTDNTVPIAQDLTKSFKNLIVHDLPVASKPLAWNTAFSECNDDYIIFSDGDIEAEVGAIDEIYQSLIRNDRYYISCCEFWPMFNGTTMQQKMVGFMQIPLVQNFLSGQLYGIKRKPIKKILNAMGLNGLPSGVVGEDEFLRTIIDSSNFYVTNKKVYYKPASLSDYIKYLARMQWQQKQINDVYGRKFNIIQARPENSIDVVRSKLLYRRGGLRLMLGMVSALSRSCFKIVNWNRINKKFESLGDIEANGDSILGLKTRADSSKI